MLRRISRTCNKNIILTDVSLLYKNNITCIVDKFHNVVANHEPTFMDLGKITKTVKDWSFYDYTTRYLERTNGTLKLYVTLSNDIKSNEVKKYTRLSYWTSISPIYQEKTENISIDDTKKRFHLLQKNTFKKLYVSCINECPYTGSIDIDYTLHELCRYYHTYTFDEICLCDTCGKLTYEEFKYLAYSLVVFGVPKSKLGFQLSKNTDSQRIFQNGYRNGFLNWDVVCDFDESKYGFLTYNTIQKWI